MKKITQKWFEFAGNDLRNAEILFKNKSYEGAIWHCHQAVEKYLKGVLIEIDKLVSKTHDLPSLLVEVGFGAPKEILNFIQDLNAYYQPSRYPDTALLNPLSYDRKTANNFLKLTKIIIKWLRYQIHTKK